MLNLLTDTLDLLYKALLLCDTRVEDYEQLHPSPVLMWCRVVFVHKRDVISLSPAYMNHIEKAFSDKDTMRHQDWFLHVSYLDRSSEDYSYIRHDCIDRYHSALWLFVESLNMRARHDKNQVQYGRYSVVNIFIN